MLRRWTTIASSSTVATSSRLRLEVAPLLSLPLADPTCVDVFAAKGDQWDPAQLEPTTRLGRHYLSVVASWADVWRGQRRPGTKEKKGLGRGQLPSSLCTALLQQAARSCDHLYSQACPSPSCLILTGQPKMIGTKKQKSGGQEA